MGSGCRARSWPRGYAEAVSSVPPDPSADPAPAPDDTAAFSRFYLGDPDGQRDDAPSHGPLYRLFVGWWRNR